MAEPQNLPNINLPQRTITITGTMTARLFQMAIRASRIDLRSMQVALAPPNVRDPSNRAVDRLMAAVARFEEELTLAEKDIEAASNNKSNRRGSAPAAANQHQGRDARPQAKGASKDASAANTATGGQDPAGSTSAKSRSRNRNSKNKGGATSPQSTGGAQQPAPQETPTPVPTAVQPNAAQDVVSLGGSAGSAEPATRQRVAPEADVAATLQAL